MKFDETPSNLLQIRVVEGAGERDSYTFCCNLLK